MKYSTHVLGLVAALFVTSTLIAAQNPPGGAAQGRGGGGAQLPPITNLQVLPKDISQQQLLQTMGAFTRALGVNCGHCHNWIGQRNPANDYASDAKPAKNVARAMMRMVQDINGRIPGAVNKTAEEATRVQCATCHRGAAIPQVDAPPARQGGAPAAQPAPPAQ